MDLFEIIQLVNGRLLTNDFINKHYDSAFACDLMSDCLAFVNEKCLLITGLTNLQSLRTAEMLDIDCIIYVRGKVPDQGMINFANQKNMTLITTTLTMYETSGVLYTAGLSSLKL